MKIIILALTILISGVLIAPDVLFTPTYASFRAPDAQLPAKGAIPDPKASGLFGGTSFIESVSIIIRWVLGFIGIIVFIIFLFAGFEYATAGDSPDKAKSAQSRMVNAVIGLIIIFFAFVASNAILSFIFPDSVAEDDVEANISNIINQK